MRNEIDFFDLGKTYIPLIKFERSGDVVIRITNKTQVNVVVTPTPDFEDPICVVTSGMFVMLDPRIVMEGQTFYVKIFGEQFLTTLLPVGSVEIECMYCK